MLGRIFVWSRRRVVSRCSSGSHWAKTRAGWHTPQEEATQSVSKRWGKQNSQRLGQILAKVTVPLPNISQRKDLTIKEGLEASLEGAQRPGGQKTILTLPLAKGNSFKTSLTSPPTKDPSFTDKRKIPPIANEIQLRNLNDEKKFRREKKKKMKSQAKTKKI